MKNMRILQSVSIFILCMTLFGVKSVLNRKLNKRLGIVEDRLDDIASEITNFRDGVKEICNRCVCTNQTKSSEMECSKNKEDNTKMSINNEKLFTDFKQTLSSEFHAEKQTMHSFRNSVNESLKNNQILCEKQVTEIDVKYNNRLSMLETTFNDLQKPKQVTENDTNYNNRLLMLEHAFNDLQKQKQVTENDANYNNRLSMLEHTLNDLQNQFQVKITAVEQEISDRLSMFEHTFNDLQKKFQAKITAMEQDISAYKLELSNLTLNNEHFIVKYQNLENKQTTQEASPCKRGWYQYRDSCYYLNREQMTWFQALEWCKLNEAKLVEYDDIDELRLVLDLATKTSTWSDHDWEGFWVGADDIETERNFKWSTSHNPVSSGFQFWWPEQPDVISVNEDCMTTLVNKNGFWNDDSCEKEHQFVCEKHLLN